MLPRDADRAALAKQWALQRTLLDRDTHDQVVNAALGLPHWTGQGPRDSVEASQSWVPEERDARLEMARRELAELAELAERWRQESILMDRETMDRIFNVALGLPECENTGQVHKVIHERSWLPDELEAEFELARRKLGVTASLRLRPSRRWWQIRSPMPRRR